jgi:hypothetical protein
VAQRSIKIRDHLIQTVTMIDADQWAKWRGLTRSNPSAALGKHKQAGRAFAVQVGPRDLYPAFQFDQRDAKPLPGMALVLSKVPEGSRGWPLLSWLEAENRLLGGSKPSNLLQSAAQQVADAAERFFSTDE